MAAAEKLVQAAWQELSAAYTPNSSLQEQLWQEIEKAYTAKGRHYHNLQHLAQLLALTKRWEASISDPDAFRFAIFYHDIVYKAISKTNEEDSAQLALERLQLLKVSPAMQERVEQLILATKSHTSSADKDTEMLLDFDLSILAADWEDYLSYSRQIRKEYSLIPYFLYKKGRKKVLQHFLALPRIYKTPHFVEQHEAKARQNLEQELKMLSA